MGGIDGRTIFHDGVVNSGRLFTGSIDDFYLHNKALTAGEVMTIHNLVSPLVIDMDGDGIETLAKNSNVIFDINNDGVLDNTGWVAPDDALLVVDINGDGQINNGGELFGEGMIKSDGTRATDGFDALAEYDSDGNGIINNQDEHFESLMVWQDKNSDGVVQDGELSTLVDAGIEYINLTANSISESDNGNVLGLLSDYVDTDGNSKVIADVWFSYQNTDLLEYDGTQLSEPQNETSYVLFTEHQQLEHTLDSTEAIISPIADKLVTLPGLAHQLDGSWDDMHLMTQIEEEQTNELPVLLDTVFNDPELLHQEEPNISTLLSDTNNILLNEMDYDQQVMVNGLKFDMILKEVTPIDISPNSLIDDLTYDYYLDV